MIIVTQKNKTKLVLNDKQLSDLVSLLAVGVVEFDKLKDKEVTTTREDLLELSDHIFKTIGINFKDRQDIQNGQHRKSN